MQNAGLHATAPIQVTPAAAVLRGGGLQKHLGSFFQGESPVTDPNALTNILTTRGQDLGTTFKSQVIRTVKVAFHQRVTELQNLQNGCSRQHKRITFYIILFYNFRLFFFFFGNESLKIRQIRNKSIKRILIYSSIHQTIGK